MGFSRQEYWNCHSLLQGIFPTQGLKPGLPHCRQILYPQSHQGSPRPSSGVDLRDCGSTTTISLTAQGFLPADGLLPGGGGWEPQGPREPQALLTPTFGRLLSPASMKNPRISFSLAWLDHTPLSAMTTLALTGQTYAMCQGAVVCGALSPPCVGKGSFPKEGWLGAVMQTKGAGMSTG